MKILYIECNTEFTADMLLGAMIDMGASVYYIQNMLKDAGFDAQIMHDCVKRNGMEAEYAYCKFENEVQNLQIPDDIKDIFVKNFDITCVSLEEFCSILAACYGVKCFSPDYIVCSEFIGDSNIQKNFLKSICNEAGTPPEGNMICVGYGAGESDILRVVLYSTQSDVEFAQLELENAAFN